MCAFAFESQRMTVTLFIPCFVDALFPRAGISMVQILERLGHTVICPPEISCCGQPPFNSGYWDEARPVAAKVLEQLADAEAVVIGSGSCGPQEPEPMTTASASASCSRTLAATGRASSQ